MTHIIYEIRIEGHLDPSWFEWLEGMTVTHLEDKTLLFGPVADQAAMHGILNRIHDLNLKLLSVQRKDDLSND